MNQNHPGQQFVGKQEPRSIPVYEAKNRINAAHEAASKMAASIAEAINDLESRLSSVLVPVPPATPDSVASDMAKSAMCARNLVPVPASKSPLTETLHSAAQDAETHSRYLDQLRMRINALIDRIEA